MIQCKSKYYISYFVQKTILKQIFENSTVLNNNVNSQIHHQFENLRK